MINWIWNGKYHYAEHNPTIRADKNMNVYAGGGGGTEIHNPTPPQPQTVGESMSDYVESLPALYEAQMEYAPRLAEQQVGLAQQFAAPMGQAMKTAQAEMYPETTALQEQLANKASEGAAGQVPEWAAEQYRSDLAANIGTNAGSGIGADYMSRGMMQQAQDYQRHNEDLALSLMGRQPLSQPGMPQTGNWMQGYTPQAALGYNAGTYGSYAQAGRPLTTTNPTSLWGFLGLGQAQL